MRIVMPYLLFFKKRKKINCRLLQITLTQTSKWSLSNSKILTKFLIIFN